MLLLSACEKKPSGKPQAILMTVTGYCPCKKCTGWKRNWLFRPVFSKGRNKGKPKKVGVTAQGTKAKRGTIAADISLFPFGTIMEIPGYGFGKVEDVGSAIRGRHIDLFFPSHQKALKWGKQKLRVLVWKKV
jgi:3D (Asp-Asp-Asp) domain-containing protein